MNEHKNCAIGSRNSAVSVEKCLLLESGWRISCRPTNTKIIQAMHGKFFLVFGLGTLITLLYGVLYTILYTPEQNCSMTYMFEFPNFIKIQFRENENFPKYNLFAYSEGHLTEAARNMQFTGAPVLFIPGNKGSYKQVRSLASVSLRKGIDNNWIQHLDYFTVDLNEELSGLFGGILEEQTHYIEHAIKAILNLYKNLPNKPKTIVIVGHSMGGKIAQSLLISPNTSSLINSVITLATPFDKPVLMLDQETYNYYQKIDKFWLENRSNINLVTNVTNHCKNSVLRPVVPEEEKKLLDDKLLITIGGGSRDLLVHSGLTDSKFSDLHVMAPNIPNVWVSTDHLCAVWCLQLVLVVNRFLYSIIEPIKQKGSVSLGQMFIEDKLTRLQKAELYFEGKQPVRSKDEVSFEDDQADWVEDSRRVFFEQFKDGINKTRVQMIRLTDNEHQKTLKVEVVNLENSDWIFGCNSKEINGPSRHCSRATSISHYAKKLPSKRHERTFVSIDLHEVKQKHPTWSHILLRFLPTKEPFQINVDVHRPSDREIRVNVPKWYSFSTQPILSETMMSTLYYKLNFVGLEEAHAALELTITPKKCGKNLRHIIAKVCVPWASGFDRFHHFTETTTNSMQVYTPKQRPLNYNNTANPVSVELFLDPTCRYSIEVKNSFGMILSRIVHQFGHWMPAHLVAIILLAFKHQLSITPVGEAFKTGAFHKALSTCTPFFVITASRVFVKLILMMKLAPKPESFEPSLMVSIIIHGSAIAILALATGATWISITFCGNLAHKLLFKLVSLPIPAISDFLISVIEKFPISAVVCLISLGYGSCGGIALMVTCVLYFILLTKMYEDYLEKFVFKTARMIARKLFGGRREAKDLPAEQVPEEVKLSTTEEVVSKDFNPEDEELDDDNKEAEEKLNKLMEESMKQRREENLKKEKELLFARQEYDQVVSGLSAINFHLPLFFLLVIATLLNAPSVITWAKNFSYSIVLTPDPSLIPATIILVALGVIWQLPSPRNVMAYKPISSLCYVAAVICVLYCQESIFRLNYVISGVFLIISLHQLLGPRQDSKKDETDEEATDALKTNYDRLKTIRGFFK